MTTMSVTANGVARAPVPEHGLCTVTGARSLGELVLRAAERHGGVALRHHDGRGWADVSYAELGRRAREIAGGLLALGVGGGDRVAVLAATRAEWTAVDCGILCAGAVVVPIYHTNSPRECLHVLGHSGARVVICEDAEQLDKVAAVAGDLPALEHVITFDESGPMSLDALRRLGADRAGDEVDAAVAAVVPGDVATIIYTSGTTGPPKGCLTTHANCLATVAMYEDRLDLRAGGEMVVYLFLPLAHSLTRMTELVALDVGGTLAFWRGDMQRVAEDLAELSPTHLPVVPRVLEKIHTRVLATAGDAGRLQSAALDCAVSIGRRVRAAQRRGARPGALGRAAHGVADRLVLARVRATLGARLQVVLTGAAPISPEVLEFFDACGVLVLEGYGMTETTAAATLNTASDHRFGTVGLPLPGTEVAIAPDGEILMRGPHVFAGYHRDPEATRETVTEDGWLRSGDLGSIDADGFVRVTGRKKELIVTSSGKNIAPAAMEAELAGRRWISQALVYGDRRPYVVALLTLDPRQLAELAERCGVEADMHTMASEPAVRAEVQREVDAANATVARIEQVKRFAILDHELSQADGELTPTAKVRRAVVCERYRDTLDALYDGAGAG